MSHLSKALLLLADPAQAQAWQRALTPIVASVQAASDARALSAWIGGGEPALVVAELDRLRGEPALFERMRQRSPAAPLILVKAAHPTPDIAAPDWRDAVRLGALELCHEPPAPAELRALLELAGRRCELFVTSSPRGELQRFVGYLSHLLRTPVTALKSTLAILDDAAAHGESEAATQRFSDMGRRNVRRLTGIVERIEELVALEHGELTVRPADATLEELAEKIRGWLTRLRPDELRRLDLCVVQPRATLRCDSGRTAQLLAQFFGAAAAMIAGDRRAAGRIELRGTGASEFWLCCHVTGIGAAAEGLALPEHWGGGPEALERLMRFELSNRLLLLLGARLRWEAPGARAPSPAGAPGSSASTLAQPTQRALGTGAAGWTAVLELPVTSVVSPELLPN